MKDEKLTLENFKKLTISDLCIRGNPSGVDSQKYNELIFLKQELERLLNAMAHTSKPNMIAYLIEKYAGSKVTVEDWSKACAQFPFFVCNLNRKIAKDIEYGFSNRHVPTLLIYDALSDEYRVGINDESDFLDQAYKLDVPNEVGMNSDVKSMHMEVHAQLDLIHTALFEFSIDAYNKAVEKSHDIMRATWEKLRTNNSKKEVKLNQPRLNATL